MLTPRFRHETSMDQLAIAIKLLLGDGEEKFTYERQLRMFQFQCWLLDTWKQESSFRQSAMRFGCAVLSREISRTRSRNRSLRTRDCLLLAIATKEIEEVINRCFVKPLNIYDLLRVSRFPHSKQDHDDAAVTIEKLNTVLDVRLRLHAAGQPSSLAKTWEMLPKLVKGIGEETATTIPVCRQSRRERVFDYELREDGRREQIYNRRGIVVADSREGGKSRGVSKVVRRGQ